MALDRSRAYEVDNGIITDDGVWITSGSAAPTHSAEAGDRYYQTDGKVWRNTSSPSPGTTWDELTFGAVGKFLQYTFVSVSATVIDKWLGVYETGAVADETGHSIPFASQLATLTFDNKNSTKCDVEIFKNGTSPGDKVFTWSIDGFQHKWKTNGLSGVTFAQGDVLRIFLKFTGEQSDAKPSNVVVTTGFVTTSENLGEGGS